MKINTRTFFQVPNDWICGIQRFFSGFCFTIVYAALLTKTNRIARIFRAGKRTKKRPHLISPESQLIICSTIILVQVLLAGGWMFVRPPKAVKLYPPDGHLLVCSETVEFTYLINECVYSKFCQKITKIMNRIRSFTNRSNQWLT